jgi:hypothetical protein
VKATPVPESLPQLPKTMATMLTAVPRSAGMRSWRRYRMARGAFQESKTAMTARRICSRGSAGKSLPVCSRTMPLNVSTRACSSSAPRSVSWRSLLSVSSACSNSSPSIPSTVLPNIWMSRR